MEKTKAVSNIDDRPVNMERMRAGAKRLLEKAVFIRQKMEDFYGNRTSMANTK